MASIVDRHTLQHMMHAGHPLTKLDGQNREFFCDACKTSGDAAAGRYRCNRCNIDLHEYCTSCPFTLSTFMHSRHKLQLVSSKAANTCDLCQNECKGFFYRCKICDFDLHPVCTRLPQYVTHAAHPQHRLHLVPRKRGYDVCKEKVKGFFYRCSDCDFDFNRHLSCGWLSGDEQGGSSEGRSKEYLKAAGKVAGKVAGSVFLNALGLDPLFLNVLGLDPGLLIDLFFDN